MDFETSKAEWIEFRYSNGDSKHVHVVTLMPKSWLSVHQDQTEIWRRVTGRRREKWLHYFARQGERSSGTSRIVLLLANREAIQSGKECDRDQSSNSLPSFREASKEARLLTKLRSVLGRLKAKYSRA